MELGTPALSVSAIDEQERYNSNVKEKSTYAKGTPIYLTPQIKGKAGEVYLRFSQKSAGGNRVDGRQAPRHDPRRRWKRDRLGRHGVWLRRSLRVLVARTEHLSRPVHGGHDAGNRPSRAASSKASLNSPSSKPCTRRVIRLFLQRKDVRGRTDRPGPSVAPVGGLAFVVGPLTGSSILLHAHRRFYAELTTRIISTLLFG